jgi:hypothetical protein
MILKEVSDPTLGKGNQTIYAYVAPDPEYYRIKYNGQKYKVKVKNTKEGVELRLEEMDLTSFAPNTTIKEIKGKIEI